ncbi:MAG: hypothetical protein EA426_16545 [Spirochaetaceae bacterium]|nr:MAG: hypothetical protein EA426_16545 [Spirochaetaceae bacterium]
MDSPRIEAIVFDYGGVLSLFQDEQSWSAILDVLGVTSETARPVFWLHRHEYDRGDIDGVEFWSRVTSDLGVNVEPSRFAFLIGLDSMSWSRLNTALLAWALALPDAGRRIGICSNMPIELTEDLLEGRHWLTRFEHVVASCRIGVNKPDPVIFTRFIDLFDLPAERIAFIDDSQQNVDGARAVGIQSVVFRANRELARDLARLDSSLPEGPRA